MAANRFRKLAGECKGIRKRHGRKVLEHLSQDKLPVGVKQWPELWCRQPNEVNLDVHDVQIIADIQRQIDSLRMTVENAYEHHHADLSESESDAGLATCSESSFSSSAPHYDSDAGEMHPVLRTYDEPDVGFTDAESASQSGEQVPMLGQAPNKKRKLTRLSSQEAVDRYNIGYESDSSSEVMGASSSSVTCNIFVPADASASSTAAPHELMSSQDAVFRFCSEPSAGADDSE